MKSQSVTGNQTSGLPPHVDKALSTLIAAARESFGSDLRSVVLFGSGAEGKLRMTSDVNLLFILNRFIQSQIDTIREPLRAAHVAARVEVMFLLDSELKTAADAFAVKFSDISRRHLVLYGENLVKGLTPSRDAKIQKLKQILVNLVLRLRARYAMTSLREEQLATVIAEAAAPLRAAAATLLELEGQSAPSPKEALETVLKSLKWDRWKETVDFVSEAREKRSLPSGVGPSVVFRLIEIAEGLGAYLERMARDDSESI